MGNRIITKEGVRDNPLIVKNIIPVSQLHKSYLVRNETGKKRAKFFNVIFPMKREADLKLLSFTGDPQFKDRVMKHNHLITKRVAKVFQFYFCHQMKHEAEK